MLGADEDNALFFHAFGELGVLAQETIARVHRLRAGLFARGNDLFGQQITLAAGRGADVDRLVGKLYMARVLVRIRIHSHGFDAHLAGGSDDAAGDFATVGDQNFCEHGGSLRKFGMGHIAGGFI